MIAALGAMKNIFQILILAVALASNACHAGNTEAFNQHLKIVDAEKRQLFLDKLSREQIDFKVNEDGSISYSPEKSEEVHSILRQVLGLPKIDKPQGVSVKAEISPQVAQALAEERIPFELVYSEDGRSAVFKWLNYPYDAAERVVRDVVQSYEHGS